MRARSRTREDGFSLVELMVVAAMTLVIAVVATPSIVNTMYSIRLRSSASAVSGLLQSTRMDAVKRNRTVGAFYTTMGSGGAAWVELDNTTGLSSGDRVVQLSGSVRRVTTLPTGVAELTNTQLGFAPPAPNLALDLSFNSRGLPVDASNTQRGFAFYFADTRPLGASGVAAVSVTPAGRIKTWMWNGAAWAN